MKATNINTPILNIGETVNQVGHPFPIIGTNNTGVFSAYKTTNNYQLADPTDATKTARYLVYNVKDANTFDVCQFGRISITDSIDIADITKFSTTVSIGNYYYVGLGGVGFVSETDTAGLAAITNKIKLFQVISIISGVTTIDVLPTANSTGSGSGNWEVDITQTAHPFWSGTTGIVGVAAYHDGTSYLLADSNSETTVGRFIVTRVVDANHFTIASGGRVVIDDAIFAASITTMGYYYVKNDGTGGLTTSDVGSVISNPIIQVISKTANKVTLDILPYRSSANIPSNFIGTDFEYLTITGTTDNANSLVVEQTGSTGITSGLFNIANFTYTGSTFNIRRLSILVESIPAVNTDDIIITCTYPDGSVITLSDNTATGSAANTNSKTIDIPINQNQISITLTVNVTGAGTGRVTILGATQVVLVGNPANGSGSIANSILDIAYSNITNYNNTGVLTYEILNTSPNLNKVRTPFTFNIANIQGNNLDTADIRLLHILAEINVDTSAIPQWVDLDITMPDGSIRNWHRWKTTWSTIHLTENVLLSIPINKGQTFVTIYLDTVNTNYSLNTSEYCKFTLVGASYVKKVSLAPGIDTRYLTGSTNTRNVNSTSGTVTSFTEIWDSLNNTTHVNWSTVFPIIIPVKVTKSIIDIKGINTQSAGIDKETITIGSVTIDWINQTINGYIMLSAGSVVEDNIYRLTSTDFIGAKPFLLSGGVAATVVPSITIVGNTIIELPTAAFAASRDDIISYTITNYKTVDSASLATLSDSPGSYAAAGGSMVKINAGGTGFEYAPVPVPQKLTTFLPSVIVIANLFNTNQVATIDLKIAPYNVPSDVSFIIVTMRLVSNSNNSGVVTINTSGYSRSYSTSGASKYLDVNIPITNGLITITTDLHSTIQISLSGYGY